MLKAEHVVVGFHHTGSVAGRFAFCLARAAAYEGNRIKSCIDLPSPYVDDARNRIVETFLATPTAPRYLLMLDADIEFEKDAISRTMYIAQHQDADVVWGNYALGTFSNSLFRKADEGDLAIPMDDLQPDMVYPGVYAGGTGWCLMDRRILLRMQEECPGPWHWFDRDVVVGEGGKLVKMGEDLTFGKRVHSLGGKQLGYTGLFLIHHKLHGTVPQFMQGVAEELGRTVVNSNPSSEEKK